MRTTQPIVREKLFAVVETKRGCRPEVFTVTDRENADEIVGDLASDPARSRGYKFHLRPVRL